MAGDWVPWVKGLRRRPEVIRMAAALSRPREFVCCDLMEVWEWCDSEGHFDLMSRDCHVNGVTLTFLVTLTGVTGFDEAMKLCGWVREAEDGHPVFPKLGRWVGKSAKERLLATDRKRKERQKSVTNVTDMSRSERDKTVSRGEESRSISSNEEIQDSSKPPPAASEPPFLVFPVVGNGMHEWPLFQGKVLEYTQTYPGIDAPAECRKARQWCVDNPAKRKTAKGMTAFLNRWMQKAQNESCHVPLLSNPQDHDQPPDLQ